MGKKFIGELKEFLDCGELVQKIHTPVLFIAAGKAKMGKQYYEKANKPKKFISIPTADHNFNKIKDEQRLLYETYKLDSIVPTPSPQEHFHFHSCLRSLKIRSSKSARHL